MTRLHLTTIKIFTFIALFSLASCMTQLAPNYDRALFSGLTETNAKIMELFASVSSGTDKSTFNNRDATYNVLIGRIDALALQSRARPVPENKVTEKVNKYLESRGIGSLTGGEAPSAAALDEVSKNLVKMKAQDKKTGLKPTVIAVFKNAIVISMDQAITYEAFLDR